MLHVALLTSLFSPSVGGIQSHTRALAEALPAKGVKVTVITRRALGHSDRDRVGSSLVLRVGASPGAPRAVATAGYVAGAIRAVRALRPDVLHAHQLLSPTTAAIASAPLVGAPILLNPHACGPIGDVGVLSSSAVGRWRLRVAIRRADGFVAINAPIRDELLSWGAEPSRIHPVPNGVDLERFRPPTLTERREAREALRVAVDRPLAVYTGRLAPEKGVDVLVGAWPRVLAAVPGARLLLVGQGDERERLLASARALGVLPFVELPGSGDAAQALRAADVAVLPSRTEGMPMALLEAMACGTPIVATAVGGSLEILRGGESGRLVPPDDPGSLADAIVNVFNDPAAAAGRARAALALVTSRFSIDIVTDRLLELYLSLLREPRWRRNRAGSSWSRLET